MFKPSAHSNLGTDLQSDASRVVAVMPYYPGYWGSAGPSGPAGASGPGGPDGEYGIVPVIAAAIIGAGTTIASLVGSKVGTGAKRQQEHELNLLREQQALEAQRAAARNRTLAYVGGGLVVLLVGAAVLKNVRSA